MLWGWNIGSMMYFGVDDIQEVALVTEPRASMCGKHASPCSCHSLPCISRVVGDNNLQLTAPEWEFASQIDKCFGFDTAVGGSATRATGGQGRGRQRIEGRGCRQAHGPPVWLHCHAGFHGIWCVL